MRRGSSAATALPLLVASSGSASWVDVLATYRRTCQLLRGVYQPTAEELHQGLSRMETSWGVSLFYYEVIKDTCGYKQPPARLVSTALERFKRCGHFYAIKRVMEEDVDVSTHEGRRSVLTYTLFTGMWEHGLALYESSDRMQNNLADTRVMVNLLSLHGRWKEALHLLRRQSPTSLNSRFIKPVVRSLGLAGEYRRMLRLVAVFLAQGHQMDGNLFSVLVRPLQRGGHWHAALNTAVELGLLSSSRESSLKHIGTYGGLSDCLYSVDPYANFTLREIVDDMTRRMNPRGISLGSSQKSRKAFRLLAPSEMFRMYQRYLSPLSTIYVNLLGVTNAHFRPVSELADEAFRQGETLLILDTNFLLQITAKNLPLSHFYAPIRNKYRCLEEKSLQRVILPFTTVREIQQLIWSPGTQLRRAVRTLLWSRVVSFLRHPSVTVLALSSEFPCMSFSVISRLAYLRLNEPASENDPDLRILNTCLCLQYTFRQRHAAALQGAAMMSEGTMLFSFLKYHMRRHLRDVRGVASEQLLLCTLDKRLSAAANELGIQTFPQFDLSEETTFDAKDK